MKIYSITYKDDIIYIGKTNRNLNTRLNEHKYRKFSDYKEHIKIELIDEVNSDIDFWETHYIDLFRSFGFNLKNSYTGGTNGRKLYVKPWKPNLGRKFSQEWKENIGKGVKKEQ